MPNGSDLSSVVDEAEAVVVAPIAVSCSLKPAWGFPPPSNENVLCAWGARAIYKFNFDRDHRGRREPPMIDLLWDRQDFVPHVDAPEVEVALVRGKEKLQKWLNTKGLKKLATKCLKECITGDCGDVVAITDGDFGIIASPRQSYGYLYIGAWLIARAR